MNVLHIEVQGILVLGHNNLNTNEACEKASFLNLAMLREL